MRVVFFGTPSFVVPVLEIIDKNFQLVGVVTAPTESAVSQQAQRHNIPVLKPTNLDQSFKQKLSGLNVDLGVVASYGQIIPKNILDIPRNGFLNIHPSLLPTYRGPSPIQTAILHGDKVSGVTIIKMDEEIDHGPIISTKEITLSEKDNFQTLSSKMFQEGAKLLVQTIPDFAAGKLQLKEQNHSIASFTKIIKKEDGYFEINNPPSLDILDRMIRAYYPWPTAWTIWRIKNQESGIKEKIVKLLPGGLIQMEGKKPISFRDFLNGYPDFPLKEQLMALEA